MAVLLEVDDQDSVDRDWTDVGDEFANEFVDIEASAQIFEVNVRHRGTSAAAMLLYCIYYGLVLV